jgi:hypothetical protein
VTDDSPPMEPRPVAPRLTGMRRTSVAAVAAAAAMAGCGSSSNGGAGVVPTGTPTGVGGVPSQGLRGIALPSASCHQQPTAATSTMPVAAADVSSLILCPLATPNARPRRVVLRPGDASFDPIVTALAAPDQPPPATPQPCPEFADVSALVIAVTASGAFALAVPVDSCHHYQPAALAALTAARGAATPTSMPGGAS